MLSGQMHTFASRWSGDAALNEDCIKVAFRWDRAFQDVSQHFVFILWRKFLLLMLVWYRLLDFTHIKGRRLMSITRTPLPVQGFTQFRCP